MSQNKVSRYEPCPICGYTDWCFNFDVNDEYITNGLIHACRRTAKVNLDGISVDTKVSGQDGVIYVYIGDTKKDGVAMFQALTEREARSKAWKEKRGFSDGSKKSNYKKAVMPQRTTRKPEHISKSRSNEELDKVYRCLLDNLILEPEHKAMLVADGWSEELLRANNIKSLPVNDYVRYQNASKLLVNGKPFDTCQNAWRYALVTKVQELVGEDLSGIPGFCKIDGKWKLSGAPGILFPGYDARHLVYGLEIRRDVVTKKGGKYQPLSTNPELLDANKKQKYPCGTSAGSRPSILFDPNVDSSYVAYITEGKKKAIVSNYCMHAPIVSLQGVGSIGSLTDIIVDEVLQYNTLDYLKSIGTKVVVLALDADKDVNPDVAKAFYNLVQLLQKYDFQVGNAYWDLALAKGIDDLLFLGLRPGYEYIK